MRKPATLLKNYIYRIFNYLMVRAPFFDRIFICWYLKPKFQQLFKNKTVAVVGNGPGLIGSALGTQIDHHDVVVRINLVQPTGREKDIGSRTDVRLIGATMLEHHISYVTNIAGTGEILTTSKNQHFMKKLGIRCYLYPFRAPMHALSFINSIYGDAINVDLTGKPPRTGIVILSLLLKLGRPSKTTLYGFSFGKDGITESINFSGVGIRTYDASDFNQNHCDPMLEVDLLRKLERLGAISNGG